MSQAFSCLVLCIINTNSPPLIALLVVSIVKLLIVLPIVVYV